MYKSKLQELCHGKKWGLPRYTTMKDGPDHNPAFKASVSVNGFSFDSPAACKSSKKAQNQAAMLAFLHFTSPPSSFSSVEPTVTADHEHTIESKEFFNTLKGPEHAAANAVSMSSSQDGAQTSASSLNFLVIYLSLFGGCQNEQYLMVESGHCKNLLQELAQREGFYMPQYKTARSGASHLPTFSSTVEVEGEEFYGKAGKSKKQAELSAAKVAYIALKERGLSRATEITSCHLREGALKTTQSSDLRMTVDSVKNLIHEEQLVSSPDIKYEECTLHDLSANANLEAEVCDSFQAVLEMDNIKETGNPSSCSELMFPSTEESPSSPAFIQPNLPAVTNVGIGTGVRSYLLCNRVRVYTQFPDIAFPNRITVLPVSDDKWVAFRLEFPNEESN
ncbi:double-stranded RNA-binding protein 1-like [Prunus persica]|uniref:double-stranded RNA-binding protein 1-like n=1 Tax=Prunus persica TaxID=3760 RepID=UPI0009AB85BE|nr:double-stranded RNA-binding protein 1-like [Prunus persica]